MTLKTTICISFIILLASACFCGIMAFDQMLAQMQSRPMPLVIHNARYVEVIKGELFIKPAEKEVEVGKKK